MVNIIDLEPRNIFILKNKIIIENDYKIIFHFVAYFISLNKFKFIIRNLDKEYGWNNDINIKIYNLEETKFEKISIGSSLNNHKILNIITEINLYPVEYKNQKIPKIIIQTSYSNEIKNILHMNSVLSFQELNPEYKYLFFNDKRCREYIEKNFSQEIIKYYDLLFPGAFKADFFRYCFLYNEGGCYFDFKAILRVPLRNLIKDDSKLILCKDNHPTGIYNAIILTEKKNDLFINCIKKIIYKINNFEKIYNFNFNNIIKYKEFIKLENILSLTGPNLLYEVYYEHFKTDKYINFKHNVRGSHYIYKNLTIEYKNNIIIYKNYADYKTYGKHYSELWKNLEILYQNEIYLNNYKILFYPTKNKINFNVYILRNDMLIIHNLDENNLENKDDKIYNFNIINDNNEINLLSFNYKSEKFYFLKLEKKIYIEKIIDDFECNIDKLFFDINICKLNNNFYLLIYNKFNKELMNLKFNIKLLNGNIIEENFESIKKIIVKKIKI